MSEKEAVELYLDFIRQVNHSSVYLKVLSYQIDEQQQEGQKLIVETWKYGDRYHIKSAFFEQFVDTVFHVNIIHSEKKIVVTKIDLMDNKSLEEQKDYYESMSYDNILKEAWISVREGNLEINYKPGFNQVYGIKKLLIYIKDEQVTSLEIHKLVNGNSPIEVSQYLEVNTSVEKDSFEGSAIGQVISGNKLKEKYQTYQLVNLSGEAIN